MRDPFDVTTLLLAALAAFVLWKLWSVLGARGGRETTRDPGVKTGPKLAAPGDSEPTASNVVQLPGAMADQNVPHVDRWAGIAQPGSSLSKGLEAIANSDTGFSPQAFLTGAGKAYEMIVTAFANGDRKMLKNLLAPDVYDSFTGAISARESRKESVETTFVSLDRSTIEDAQYKMPTAQITVRFLAKLISVTRGGDNSIIDGSAEKIVDMVDIWTFARESNNRDPNWKLIATETGH